MASFWSEYLKNNVLDHIRGVATYTPPSTTYFQLMTVAPTVVGGGTAVPSLSRLSITNNGTKWDSASGGSTTNLTDMTFTSSSPVDLGIVIGIAEYDASTSGNLLTYGDLSVAKTITTGMAFKVLAGNGEFTYIDAV